MFREQKNRGAGHVTSARSRDGAVTQVFLVHASEIVRSGLRQIVDQAPDLVIVGESDSAVAAVRGISREEPEVVIVDAALPERGAIHLARTGRTLHPGLHWVFLGRSDLEGTRSAAVAAGADGFLLDDTGGDDVRSFIREVADGRAAHGAAESSPASRTEGAHLTPREQDVLGLIRLGMTNRQIGHRLGLAEKTVKNYVSGLLVKLQVARRTQAAVYGLWLPSDNVLRPGDERLPDQDRE